VSISPIEVAEKIKMLFGRSVSPDDLFIIHVFTPVNRRCHTRLLSRLIIGYYTMLSVRQQVPAPKHTQRTSDETVCTQLPVVVTLEYSRSRS